ncbi:4Fe-4S binding protein [Beduini massiliensis]|uniref:4Fe-4S binding protein n=1 Tax=Beduini massiliensis TaxID=1585974 RepID=UPI00059A8C2C|nr:4Fe-4S binding protein [Beduini massiliensis]
MSKYIAVVGKRCVACGVCMNVCPKHAIKVENGIKAVVDKSLCIGCGICVKMCPAGIIDKAERRNHE